jgi:deferrochelatase/peroxidase EfeB
MLDQLQPNILKGHVRDQLSVLLLHFDDQADAKAFLGAVAQQLMKSAKEQLDEVEAFKTGRHTRHPVCRGGVVQDRL